MPHTKSKQRKRNAAAAASTLHTGAAGRQMPAQNDFCAENPVSIKPEKKEEDATNNHASEAYKSTHSLRCYLGEGDSRIPVIIRSQTMDRERLISELMAKTDGALHIDDEENLLDSVMYEPDGRVELTSYLSFCLELMQQDEPDRSPHSILNEILGKDFGVNEEPTGEFITEKLLNSVKLVKTTKIRVDLASSDEQILQLVASPCYCGRHIFNQNLVAIYSKHG